MKSLGKIGEERRVEFKPIRPKRIYEEIVEQIRELMCEGDLKPGDKLLPERELAEKLQVSRASVREATRALEMMGFVEIRPGDGTFIRETCTDALIQPLAMFLSLEKGSLFEIYEIRKMFEATSARLAAERATKEELVKIKEALDQMEACYNASDSEKGEEYDTAFHYAIAEATHNSWLVRLLRTISDSFFRSLSAARRQIYLTPGNPKKLLEQHRRTYEAIRDRKPDLASEAMLEHLIFAENQLRKTIKE